MQHNRSTAKIAPAVIIGAPRSGTNMLRDALTRLPGVGTWPCDEINYIWRHGNARFQSDEFSAGMARPEVIRYIRGCFDNLAMRYSLDLIVEKTCANSLRVGFVDAVLEDAKYIFIRRNGIDVVSSALSRWRADLNISYIASKARFLPLSDFPYYATRYLWNRIYRWGSSEGRLALWGPQMNDTRELLREHPLESVCAIQWKRCVDQSAAALAHMSQERCIEVIYEEFVRSPSAEFARILEFLNIEQSPELVEKCVADVADSSVGKGRRELGSDRIDRIMPLIRDTLERYGYV